MNKKHWSDDDRAEYDLALIEAWAAGTNSDDRAGEFIRIVRDAEQAQRTWAQEVLASALRDGMWRLLKAEQKSHGSRSLNFAGRLKPVPALGGIPQRGDHIEYVQMPFEDMTREELLEKQQEFDSTAFAARVGKAHMARLIALIDSVPGSTTARQACQMADIDLGTYLAEEAS